MRIDIITCSPDILKDFFAYGIIKRAIEKGVAQVYIHNLRDYGIGKYKKIDDAPYGGEAGMVLMLEPIVSCIEKLQKEHTYDKIIYLAPEGRFLTQPVANELILSKNLIFLCGHYKGIDERICQFFPIHKISIGPYVLPGGELPAAILAHSLIRLLPGAISDQSSALTDSFQDGRIAPPVYTRPARFRDKEVPSILTCGDPKKIESWRTEQSKIRTLAQEEIN